MKPSRVIFWSVTVALGGFLFGFDTAVISGAEQSIQSLWQLSETTHGIAVGIALYGTILGALFGGVPADRFGRKKTLFWIGILYLLSAIGSALSPNPYVFMVFRFIGGLGVGASSVAAPMYISEVAPAKARGWMVALFQFNIVFGILIAYFSNYLIGYFDVGGGESWRVMLGVETIPALLFSVLVMFVPRSPRWLLVKRNDQEGAREVLQLIVPPGEVEQSISSIKWSDHDKGTTQLGQFFQKRYRILILLAFLFAFFNQLSGINAIIYYTKRIFEMTGQGANAALASSVGVGLVNMLFTILGMFLIDRFGRKKLMYLGSFGLILTLGLVAYSFFSVPDLRAAPEVLAAQLGAIPVLLFAYIAFFAVSQGAVIWVFISEIFPNEIRGYGQSFGSFTHWVFAAIISSVFPAALARFGPGTIFMFFSFMMVLQLLFVWRLMPETKGVSLEELERQLIGDVEEPSEYVKAEGPAEKE